MTVFDNIAFALKLRKIERHTIQQTVVEVADMVKIGELLDRYPKQLSGGQRQRVALARALAVHPQLFLMDEPLSNLDAKLRVVMRTELKAIHQKTGATTIFVTHDQSEAMSMADRIIIMRDGEVVQSGTPDDVYKKSANVFVAGFIGTPPTNFFDVDVIRENGSLRLQGRHFAVPVGGSNLERIQGYGKEHTILGVRPEDILIVPEREGLFATEVLVVEPQGSHKIVAIDLGGEIVKIVTPPELSVAPGDQIHLRFKETGLNLFDSETEERI
jgi:multiple sugar transport system ATP-binding protein